MQARALTQVSWRTIAENCRLNKDARKSNENHSRGYLQPIYSVPVRAHAYAHGCVGVVYVCAGWWVGGEGWGGEGGAHCVRRLCG
jgi:hypothetical protein